MVGFLSCSNIVLHSNFHHASVSDRQRFLELHQSLILDRLASRNMEPQPPPCFNLGFDISHARRSHQPPRQYPGRDGPIVIVPADRCPSISRQKGMYRFTLCNSDIQASGFPQINSDVATRTYLMVYWTTAWVTRCLIAISISTAIKMSRRRTTQ